MSAPHNFCVREHIATTVQDSTDFHSQGRVVEMTVNLDDYEVGPQLLIMEFSARGVVHVHYVVRRDTEKDNSKCD
ncbi:hypothetical protein A0H81_11696 [Grifola frondosa]|uniref:Uncharacterized protein n=1 Tax=Grifola frondosa TaxID=5627 RepID=A0A1C7LUZ0_GRIFR|nr:hypothetical protein A0H81_11696 [Grifola frondosa]